MLIDFRYNECFDIYRDIIKQSKDSFTNERETNLTAVISQLSKLGDVSFIVYYYYYSLAIVFWLQK